MLPGSRNAKKFFDKCPPKGSEAGTDSKAQPKRKAKAKKTKK